MMQVFDRSPYTKKAFELAYAMIRLSRSLKAEETTRRLDDYGHQLLKIFASGQYEKSDDLLEEIGWFVRLWTDLQIIGKSLGESLLLELSRLKSISTGISETASLPDKIEELFPVATVHKEEPAKLIQPAASKPPVMRQEARIADSAPRNNSFHYDSSNRQSAILRFIEEKSVSGNGCRMKDLQDKFAFVSERTLRYDLQKLVEDRNIERVGAGPMSAYRILHSEAAEAVTTDLIGRYT
ncbi:MAG: hypothetical protein AAB691_01530 [Patescibacteria group bacterium]